MAKAKLTSLTKEWIDSKAEKQDSAEESKLKSGDIEMIKQTVYISRKANKLLWYKRVDTSATISSIVDGLILTHLEKK